MAELAAVGLASAIVTFLDVSARVVQRLQQYHSSAREAPADLREVTEQLQVIVGILQRTKDDCDAAAETASAAGASTAGSGGVMLPADAARLASVVDGCRAHVATLGALVDKLLPGPDASLIQRTRKALSSVWREKDLHAAQRRLEISMQLLTLYFSQRSAAGVDARAAVSASAPAAASELEQPLLTRKGGMFDIPPLRVAHMVERPALLEALTNALDGRETLSEPRIAVLLGLGGQGKTQLALEYIRRARAAGRYHVIVWFDATSWNSVLHGFERAAAKIAPSRVWGEADAKIAYVKDAFQRLESQWLMVYDNYDQPDDFPRVSTYFPQSAMGTILVTSRHAASERLGTTVRVTGMTEDEALELLLRQSRVERNDDSSRAGKEVVRRLGYLPLAIDQAGAYISVRKLPLENFLSHYDRRRVAVLAHTPSLWEYRRRLGDDKGETKLSVYTTWDLSFEQLHGSDLNRKAIRHFLTLAAYYGVFSVGEDIFRHHFIMSESPPPWMQRFLSEGRWDQFKYQEVVVELYNHSLVQNVEVAEAETVFSLHPLVADWLRLPAEGIPNPPSAEEALTALRNYVVSQDFNALVLGRKLEILSHVDACLFNAEEYLRQPSAWDSGRVRDAAVSFARVYRYSARFSEAQKLLHQSLAASERAVGPQQLPTLDIVHELGNLYTDRGDLAEAEAFYSRALAGQEAIRGPEHPSTLMTVNNLGALFSYQSKVERAEEMYKRALAGWEASLGPKHPFTLDAVNNLGCRLRGRGNLVKAEEMIKRALDGREEVLGPNHPSTLDTLNNLGSLYRHLGQPEKAEVLFDRALATKEQVLGANHPSTLQSVHNLGNLYTDRGELARAKEMYQRALAGREAVFGPSHKSTLQTAHSLSGVCRQLGEPALGQDVAGVTQDVDGDEIRDFSREVYWDKGTLADAESTLMTTPEPHNWSPRQAALSSQQPSAPPEAPDDEEAHRVSQSEPGSAELRAR